MVGKNSRKELAWDALGLEWYKKGRKSGKPSKEALDWYTRRIVNGTRCLIVGGTSVDLIRLANTKGGRVTVADFSERICSEVASMVPANVEIASCNILYPPQSWEDGFDVVCCDTLINRFDGPEFHRFLSITRRLLAYEGEMRTIVKLGLYEMDEKLLASAKENNIPRNFWDEATQTINYEKAQPFLEDALVRHGSISKSKLLSWYAQRGREKRFSLTELEEAFPEKGWSVEFENDASSEDRIRICASK